MKWNNCLLTIILIGVISSILYLFNIRICPFYNIFGIPCPGCGLTRAVIEIFKLNFKRALEYNFLSYVILLLGLIYIVAFLFRKSDKLNAFIEKNKTIIIILSAILMVVSFCININNPLLY